MISIATPVRSRIASTTAAPFRAARSPAVPTATMARTPAAVASATMAEIASDALVCASGVMSPPSVRPSPRRVISARSVSVRQPSDARSAMRNLTEFVPTSITANRSGRPSMMAASPCV
jgi:hypothetical protein